jgi:hypothetical protein
MFAYNNDQQKRLVNAYEELQTAQRNFNDMPSAMYFQDLHEAMLTYQEICFPAEKITGE